MKKVNKANWTLNNEQRQFLEKLCGEEDIINVIVKATGTHISNAEVCETGCGALRNMTASNSKALTVQTK